MGTYENSTTNVLSCKEVIIKFWKSSVSGPDVGIFGRNFTIEG